MLKAREAAQAAGSVSALAAPEAEWLTVPARPVPR
jgi:hypothetical protein